MEHKGILASANDKDVVQILGKPKAIFVILDLTEPALKAKSLRQGAKPPSHAEAGKPWAQDVSWLRAKVVRRQW